MTTPSFTAHRSIDFSAAPLNAAASCVAPALHRGQRGPHHPRRPLSRSHHPTPPDQELSSSPLEAKAKDRIRTGHRHVSTPPGAEANGNGFRSPTMSHTLTRLMQRVLSLRARTPKQIGDAVSRFLAMADLNSWAQCEDHAWSSILLGNGASRAVSNKFWA